MTVYKAFNRNNKNDKELYFTNQYIKAKKMQTNHIQIIGVLLVSVGSAL